MLQWMRRHRNWTALVVAVIVWLALFTVVSEVISTTAFLMALPVTRGLLAP